MRGAPPVFLFLQQAPRVPPSALKVSQHEPLQRARGTLTLMLHLHLLRQTPVAFSKTKEGCKDAACDAIVVLWQRVIELSTEALEWTPYPAVRPPFVLSDTLDGVAFPPHAIHPVVCL